MLYIRAQMNFFLIFPIILPIRLKFNTPGLHTTSLNNESLMKIGAMKNILKETKFCLCFIHFLIQIVYNSIQKMQTNTYSV